MAKKQPTEFFTSFINRTLPPLSKSLNLWFEIYVYLLTQFNGAEIKV